MNTPEGKAWCALAAAKGIGHQALWLIAAYLSSRGKTASWLLRNPDELKYILPLRRANFVMPDFGIKHEGITKSGEKPITLIHPQHPDFPQQIMILKDMVPLPALLYATGNLALLKRPAVAIVGKRNAGTTALAAARSLAGELAAKGITITSGYAAGIDTAAHLAALRAGGTTGIVLAEGIGHFHAKPELHDHLTADNTLVISQFEPDARWTAYMAMTRNKLVAALSGTVVVIVSGPERDANGRNSGTFNTGISALKMGIPVFVAAPDFFHDYPAGNAALIQRGCLEWDPAEGAFPIISKMDPPGHTKPLPSQRSLFENKKD
jgi:DNA protecting protein DprA